MESNILAVLTMPTSRAQAERRHNGLTDSMIIGLAKVAIIEGTRHDISVEAIGGAAYRVSVNKDGTAKISAAGRVVQKFDKGLASLARDTMDNIRAVLGAGIDEARKAHVAEWEALTADGVKAATPLVAHDQILANAAIVAYQKQVAEAEAARVAAQKAKEEAELNAAIAAEEAERVAKLKAEQEATKLDATQQPPTDSTPEQGVEVKKGGRKVKELASVA